MPQRKPDTLCVACSHLRQFSPQYSSLFLPLVPTLHSSSSHAPVAATCIHRAIVTHSLHYHYLCQLCFRRDVGQALRNVTLSSAL